MSEDDDLVNLLMSTIFKLGYLDFRVLKLVEAPDELDVQKR